MPVAGAAGMLFPFGSIYLPRYVLRTGDMMIAFDGICLTDASAFTFARNNPGKENNENKIKSQLI